MRGTEINQCPRGGQETWWMEGKGATNSDQNKAKGEDHEEGIQIFMRARKVAHGF